MTCLQTLREHYLAVRRSLGAKLSMTDWLLRQFIAFLAQREAMFITTALALDWATEPEGVQMAWRARRLSEVRQFARYAHSVDPRHEVPPPRLLPYSRQRPQPYIYNDAEVLDLIGAAGDLSGRLRPRTYSTMLGLLWVTGMRSGEAVRLDRGDVDLRQGVLTIRQSKYGKSRLNLCHVRFGDGAHVRCHGKGRKDRCIPLRRDSVAALRGWLKERGGGPCDPVFPNQRSRPLTHDSLAYLLARNLAVARTACPSLAKKRVTPHTLRHSAAMELLHNGVDRATIALWLGHESVETTYIYLHADLKLKERAMARTTPTETPMRRYQPEDRLLAFLNSL